MSSTLLTGDKTRQVLSAMLRENTGVAMCDSGGYPHYDAQGNYTGSDSGYGRHYERNAHINFDALPATTMEAYIRKGELDLCITHNVYHWLNERVEFSPTMDRLFQRFADRRPDDHWLSIMEEFGDRLHKRKRAGGIYGEGRPMVNNTYNGEDLLSQTLQYLFFTLEQEEYILLQIHNGADVRGGYTRPRAFTLNSELSIFDNARATLYPKLSAMDRAQLDLLPDAPDAPYWTTDDGCHWYPDGTCGRGHTQLEEYPASENPEDKGQGVIYVEDHQTIYCPVSGKLLIPSA